MAIQELIGSSPPDVINAAFLLAALVLSMMLCVFSSYEHQAHKQGKYGCCCQRLAFWWSVQSSAMYKRGTLSLCYRC